MTIRFTDGAPALALLLAVAPAPALAQTIDDSTINDSTIDDSIVATGQRADEHGPAGIMGEHVHKRGEVMLGLIWQHDNYGGANRSGTRSIADTAIAAAGFTARTRAMTMDMAMLHLMWAPNDRVTFTVMPMWMRMEMTMLGIGASGHGHHGPMPGETMRHTVSGIGDTELGALVALSRDPGLAVNAGLALSVPTGSVTRKNHDGSFVHYGMQPGSGTWDLIPSLTLTGGGEALRWGLQTRYEFRAEDRNKNGFRFGDRFDASAWLAKPLSPSLAVTGRLAYSKEGRIEGHYNAAHNHSAPPGRQANYGGKVVQAGLGANLIVGGNLRFGAEATLPIHQDLNGIQAPKRFGVNLNFSRMF
jgi:hypothetical protein